MTPQPKRADESDTPANSVGVREFHNRTSEFVKQVAETGMPLEITVHGKTVARMIPIERESAFERLRRSGMIREGKRSGFVPEPIDLPGGATVSDLVKEQRG